ncbi:ABC transporter ATP-binding protein [Thermorudis peleae]|uniref:ABC transporter ATP-binding protein n=1 Tax=Thermorudis peleae TaxID=1382356 RepID=UPI0009DFD817|nr:ABC transporter ATP-binding protein [Thermorudis peleae]
MAALLEAQDVTKVFSGGLLKRERVIALRDFSFTVPEEQPIFTAIVGESGSGKTTLARLLLGLTTPTTGDVRYRGISLKQLNREQRRAFLRDIQAIFQDPFEVYNPFYKVDHVLELPIRMFHLAKSTQEMRNRIEEALIAVGLRPEETLGRYPHQLSGGQRQRVMVARALLLRPKVIIADEPVSMVDASLRATILSSLQQLHREYGISILYITHDLATAYQVANDVLVLYRGTVVEAGDAGLIIREPEHPYTRLLVSSVPLPDPDRQWLGERALGQPVSGLTPRGTAFCVFYDRCPYAMPICVEQTPPLFRTGDRRVVACYLYRDSPTIDRRNLAAGGVFTNGKTEVSPPSYSALKREAQPDSPHA